MPISTDPASIVSPKPEVGDTSAARVADGDRCASQLNTLRAGLIVQLSPEPGVCGNPMFAGCLMVVSEVKAWGVQGYVQDLGRDEKPGGQAHYRARFAEFESTGGMAQWVIA